jgi:hypothetical protein
MLQSQHPFSINKINFFKWNEKGEKMTLSNAQNSYVGIEKMAQKLRQKVYSNNVGERS